MPQSSYARRVTHLWAVALLFGSAFVLHAQSGSEQQPVAQPASPPAEEPGMDVNQSPAPPPNAPAAENNSELSSQDHPATFKVRVNEVLVRVVVRDQKGQVVPNLRKEAFQLFDNRKPQTISSFSAETPETLALKPAATVAASADAPVDSDVEIKAALAKKMPQRFVAVLFDDAHLSLEDSTFMRDAGTRLFGALAPSDRVGIFTSSGQFTQSFTADRELLHKALLGIVPRSVTGGSGFHDCPDVSYYQADLIENQHDSQALAVATEDAVQCAFGGDETKSALAQPMAEGSSRRALARGDQETEYAYRHVEDVMRRLSVMPGQRIMVFVSPGFIPSTLWSETSGMIDRANHAAIVINTIDARGLYTPDLLGDIADPPNDSRRTRGFKGTYRVAAQHAQDQVLEEFAVGTGGTFFHNRNDVDEGLRQAVAAPPLSYLLGFSPQNLKVDGRFHQLKVTLTNKQKYTVQARNGYYAPKSVADPAESAKQEIREAIFSQEEMHDVPVDLQTQFFKKDASSARLSVLTHFDLKGIHFRKAEGRNHDNLTIATAIFDENGNFVTGGEKLVQMKLLDTTYNRLSRSGITLKSSYDVKPGSYLVRLVVRDAEGSQMAARNGAVVIPN
ncbi:MAG: VWA domain-containing protein [Acidobacteriota bacterium]|nr:VWA domain-containing protein [Acidobacteriota bacterium]